MVQLPYIHVAKTFNTSRKFRNQDKSITASIAEECARNSELLGFLYKMKDKRGSSFRSIVQKKSKVVMINKIKAPFWGICLETNYKNIYVYVYIQY